MKTTVVASNTGWWWGGANNGTLNSRLVVSRSLERPRRRRYKEQIALPPSLHQSPVTWGALIKWT